MGSKKSKRFLTLVLALIMILVFAVPASAANSSPTTGGQAAKITSFSTTGSASAGTVTAKYKGTNCTSYRVCWREAGKTAWNVINTSKTTTTIKCGKNKMVDVKVAGINSKANPKRGAYTSVKRRYIGQCASYSAKCVPTRKIQFTWKKVSGASGYYITYSKKANMSNPQHKTYNSGSVVKHTTKSLTKGTWYYQIRPFKVSGGKGH